MKTGTNFGKRDGDGKHGGSSYCRVSIIFIVFVLLFVSLGAEGVFATNETRGPGGYGWQQVFTNGGAGTGYARLTGSADRMNYSYGYKNIQIYTREEDYWSEDCGWWYVGGGNTTGIKIVDAAGDTLVATSNLAPTQGRYIYTYNWGADDDPGRWTVYVNDTMNNLAVFYLYVRGQLNVSSITTNPSTPTAGGIVTVYANVTDHTGAPVAANRQDNAGNLVTPTVTLYVSGAGESFQGISTRDDGIPPDVTANDGIWSGQFTPQNVGDHKITVKASDGNKYWVDGRGSTVVSVSGNFPASVGLAALLQTFGAMGDADPSTLVAGLASLAGVAALRLRSGR